MKELRREYGVTSSSSSRTEDFFKGLARESVSVWIDRKLDVSDMRWVARYILLVLDGTMNDAIPDIEDLFPTQKYEFPSSQD